MCNIENSEKSVTDYVAYSVYGTYLIFVDSYKDLGITIDSGLKFHVHINAVKGKAGAMNNNLLRSTVCRSVEFTITLYDSHIRPLIGYGSCVWNVGYIKDESRIERLQRKWTSKNQWFDRIRLCIPSQKNWFISH